MLIIFVYHALYNNVLYIFSRIQLLDATILGNY